MSEGASMTMLIPPAEATERLDAATRLARWRRRAQRRWCDATHPEERGSCIRAAGHRGPHRTAGQVREWRG